MAAIIAEPLVPMYECERVRVATLRVVQWTREAGLDRAHVAALEQSNGEWDPILIWGRHDVVIDGAHRVEAARRMGIASLRAHRFRGSADDAFVAAVRRNSRHGLPLAMEDRLRATRRILSRRPERSDRWIGDVCAVSAKTVARLRAELRTDPQMPALDSRVGRDGRVRPLRAAQARERILAALERDPAGSLRAVAAAAGASPETVRKVRRQLAAADDRVLADSKEPLESDSSETRTQLRSDNALSDTEFMQWFLSKSIDDWTNFVDSIPLSRVYLVAGAARERAEQWANFALALERRTQGSRGTRPAETT
jgi:hypothetical protein